MLIKLFRITILFCLFSGQCFAATYTTTQDGNWNTDATWGGGGHPTSNDDIAVIGHDVTYDAGESAVTWGNVTVNSGGMLCFPTTQSSKIVFNATAILTVNSGGEIRTGTTSAVGAVGAAYTLRFEWPQGAAARYVLVLNDGATVNIQGADVTQYAYLDSDWTSGQSFYVEGDYSSLWSAGQTFYIHVNAAYVTNGYQTQGKTYTIASVGAYDVGNDRTEITISESAPGITFSALYEGHRSKLLLVSRNVVLCDPGASLAVYGYNSYTEQIRCDLNQADGNRLVDFQRCLFYGWDRAFDGGYNLELNKCCLVNNYYGLYITTGSSGSFDCVSNYLPMYSNTSFSMGGDIASSSTSLNGSNRGTFRGEILSSLYAVSSSYDIKVYGVIFSNVRGGSTGAGYVYESDFIGNTTNLESAIARINGNIVGGTFSMESNSRNNVCVLEDATISGSDRFPLRIYTNAGNILPLDSGDTDWQVPESGNSWIMQEIPNSYCTYDTFVNQVAYSPINPMSVYTQARPTTLTFKIWPVGWTTSLDQDDVVLEAKYLDSASGITRTTVYNTSQTYANGAWRNCSVTFTPSQAGVVYFQLYFRSYESGDYVLIDPMWKVE